MTIKLTKQQRKLLTDLAWDPYRMIIYFDWSGGYRLADFCGRGPIRTLSRILCDGLRGKGLIKSIGARNAAYGDRLWVISDKGRKAVSPL